MTHLGFTGTRRGMTEAQRKALWAVIEGQSAERFRHGACLGADHQANTIAKALGLKTEAHPCTNERWRYHGPFDYCHDPKPPLERNRDIVDACELLIAAPHGPEEQRSGTWSTIRYARRIGREVMIVWPDGEVSGDG